jgi:pimeloyl-ACP methyl ester carboxylesterase
MNLKQSFLAALCAVTPFAALTFASGEALHAQVPSDTTDRLIYWVHGVNSSSVFWNKYNGYFGGLYQTQGFLQEYQSVDGIPTLADRVRTNIATTTTGARKYGSVRKPIFIGHSMGGLVSRTLVRDFPPPSAPNPNDPLDWGGIISVGTPHLGASITNALNNEYLTKLISHAKDELHGAALLSFIPATIVSQPLFFNSGLLAGSTFIQANEKTILYVLNNALDVANVQGINNECMKNMNPDSPFLQNLNSGKRSPHRHNNNRSKKLRGKHKARYVADSLHDERRTAQVIKR